MNSTVFLNKIQHTAHTIANPFQKSIILDEIPPVVKPSNEDLNKSLSTNMSFQRAQTECLDQLREMKRQLIEQERQLCEHLQQFSKQVIQEAQKTNIRIRDDFIKIIHGIFQKNAIRIVESLLPKLRQEQPELAHLKARILQISTYIDKLQQGLKGPKYKGVIAEVVTSDLNGYVEGLKKEIRDSRNTLTEKTYNLTINNESFERIKQDLMNMYVIEQTKRKNFKIEQMMQIVPADYVEVEVPRNIIQFPRPRSLFRDKNR